MSGFHVYHYVSHMKHLNDTALVLEGGGLRGVFTCGVLDCFMDDGIRFPFTVGVSAGACNGLSYMSGQRGRAKASNIDLMEEHHYVGLKYLFTQRCIMDFKLLFEEKSSSARVMDIVRASSSLPFVSPITYVDGIPMLDGGIADSIPVEYAMKQGYEKQVVVLSRLYQEGYEEARRLIGRL